MIMDLTLDEAKQYCKWRVGRVPSGDQWEVAARGTDERLFPWGSTFDPGRLPEATIVHESEDTGWAYFRPGTNRGGDSPYGVSDLSGTLPEWTIDGKVPFLRGAPDEPFGLGDNWDYSSVRVRAPKAGQRAAVRCAYEG